MHLLRWIAIIAVVVVAANVVGLLTRPTAKVLQTNSGAVPDDECPVGVSPGQSFCYTVGNDPPVIMVSLATTSLGPTLTGPAGQTLYVHAGDTSTSSACTVGCIKTLALALTDVDPAAAKSIPAAGGSRVTGTFASFSRDDGSTQVTYDGMPLYFWRGDTKPGDVTGQGQDGFTIAQP